MKIRALNIFLSVAAAAVLMWLAFKNIDFSELLNQLQSVSFYWMPFFVIVLSLSHYLRAERWRLLLEQENRNVNRSTLFAGVMLGYMVNNIIPRLGEISRPVYVARKEKISTGNLVGTIVAERLFDLIVLVSLALLSVFYLVRDPVKIQSLLGIDHWSLYHYSLIPVILLTLLLGIWFFYKIILWVDHKISFRNPVLSKLMSTGKSFSEGMISLKKVKNWPMFLLLTIGIWGGYIMMTYFPFYMLNLQQLFGLGFTDAILLTIVSAVGVSIPTPAAIGSYHLLMQQGMWLFYDIPLAEALTYATVVHASTVIFVFIIGALTLWWDKYYTLTIINKR